MTCVSKTEWQHKRIPSWMCSIKTSLSIRSLKRKKVFRLSVSITKLLLACIWLWTWTCWKFLFCIKFQYWVMSWCCTSNLQFSCVVILSCSYMSSTYFTLTCLKLTTPNISKCLQPIGQPLDSYCVLTLESECYGLD